MISLGSQTQLGIGIAIQLQDKFSGTASKVTQSLRDLRSASSSLALGAVKDYRNQQLQIAATTGAMAYGAWNLATGGMELQHKITQAMVLGGNKLKMSSKQIQTMMASIAHDYARMPQEVGDAMLENIRSGITDNLGELTKYQTAVSQIVGEQLGGEKGVASTIISAMHSYGFAGDQVGRVSNTLAAAANLSKASVNGIGEALSYAAFQAHNFNVPFEDLVAIIAKMSNAGIDNSSAGTRLKNLITYMGVNASPLAKKQALQSWAMLGINPKDIANMINQGKAIEAIDFIGQKSQGFAPTMKAGIYKNLFNLRGSDPIYAALTNTGLSGASLHELLTGIKDYQKNGGVLKQARAATNDPYSDYMRMKADWESFKMNFVVQSAPILREFLQLAMKATKALSWLVQTPVGKILGGIAAVAIPTIGILAAFRAAVLTATFALRGLQQNSSLGGFGGAMRTMADILSGGRLAGTQFANVALNKNGLPYVKAGQTFAFNGKTYIGGQRIPTGAIPNFGVGSSIANAGLATMGMTGLGIGSKITSFLGSASPMLGTMVSTGLKFLPVVGWVATLVSVGWSIYDLLKSDKKDDGRDRNIEDKVLGNVYRQLSTYRANDVVNSENGQNFLGWLKSKNPNQAPPTLNQTINVNVDGTNTTQRKLSTKLEHDIANQLDFNTIH